MWIWMCIVWLCSVFGYVSMCTFYENKCTKFQSENNNKRAETGFMVEARGKSKPLRNVMGLLQNVSSSFSLVSRWNCEREWGRKREKQPEKDGKNLVEKSQHTFTHNIKPEWYLFYGISEIDSNRPCIMTLQMWIR